MMSRNDFEILARHLKAMYPTVSSSEAIRTESGEDASYRDGYNTAINQVAGACRAVNARFDADKFKDACGHQCSHKAEVVKGPEINWDNEVNRESSLLPGLTITEV